MTNDVNNYTDLTIIKMRYFVSKLSQVIHYSLYPSDAIIYIYVCVCVCDFYLFS